MPQGSLRSSVALITLMNCLLLGETASVAHIAFIKDNKIRTKCTPVNHETTTKPIVLMHLSRTPLSVINNENQIVSEDDEYADANEEIEIPPDQGQLSYTLVELSKSQVQKLINSGKLKLIESANMNQAQVGIQLYNANADEIYDEDEQFYDDNGEMDIDDGVLYDEEDGRSRRRPWRKVQRIVRRQLIKRPQRYFRKIVRGVVG